MANLRNERVPGKAMLVGNVMIDTLVANLDRARSSDVRARLGLEGEKYAVATFHRPSNVDSKESAAKVVDALRLVARFFPVVLPIHPRTKESFDRFGFLDVLAATPGLRLVEPMGYFDFIGLVEQCKVVVTDSGGFRRRPPILAFRASRCGRIANDRRRFPSERIFLSALILSALDRNSRIYPRASSRRALCRHSGMGGQQNALWPISRRFFHD